MDWLGRHIHAQFCAEEVGDVFFGQVNGRSNDVRWRYARKLDDELTEIGLEHLNACIDQRTVQADLLSGHALDFDGALEQGLGFRVGVRFTGHGRRLML